MGHASLFLVDAFAEWPFSGIPAPIVRLGRVSAELRGDLVVLAGKARTVARGTLLV